MRQIVDRPAPLAVDVKLDADITVPRAVAWEAEAAASVLARVTPEPHGALAWNRYRDRFYRRYGEEALVPLMDLLDPHTGLGLPEDYHGTVRAPYQDTGAVTDFWWPPPSAPSPPVRIWSSTRTSSSSSPAIGQPPLRTRPLTWS